MCRERGRYMINHQLIYIALLLLISGGLMLTVDMKIYAVNHMTREKKYARIFGWVHISLFILVILSLLFYF